MELNNEKHTNNKTLTLKVSEDMLNTLNNLALATNRSKSYYIKLALEQFLEDKADYILGLAVLEANNEEYSLNKIMQKRLKRG